MLLVACYHRPNQPRGKGCDGRQHNMPNWIRRPLSSQLIALGGALLALGLFLLLVKLLMIVAWYAGGIIAAVGLILLLVGGIARDR